jgi:hypothetical protein
MALQLVPKLLPPALDTTDDITGDIDVAKYR